MKPTNEALGRLSPGLHLCQGQATGRVPGGQRTRRGTDRFRARGSTCGGYRCPSTGGEQRGYGYVGADQADELDELSNKVKDLIAAGRLDEAEAIGRDLLTRFPDEIDGLDSLADVYAARKDLPRAIEYYRKAAAFATLAPGFDPGIVRWYGEEVRRLEGLIKR